MKAWVVSILSLGVCLYVLVTYSRMVEEVASLRVINRELAFRDASLKRREDVTRPQGVNWGGILKASKYFGAPESVIYAIRRTENGGETAELGYHGKSEAVVDLYDKGLIDLEDWQYCEASRRYTSLAWEFVRQKEHWKQFTEYASKTYTGGPSQKWKAHAKSVRQFTKEIQKRKSSEASQ